MSTTSGGRSLLAPIIFFIIVFLVSFCSSQLITLNDGKFVDEYGRQRFFHGVNAVYKIPPFHPSIDGPFTPQDSFTQQDIENLKSWGFNFVRLGVMWPGVMPREGFTNTTYLNVMSTLVERLGKAGIYTLVDLHQDVYSRKFCGEGVPDFLVHPDPDRPAFAKPVLPEIPVDPATGYPSLNNCLSHSFGTYYPSAQVSRAFQELYTSSTPVQKGFLQYWDIVSSHFANLTDYVIGYEIINEPWGGDLYKDPLLLKPGFADKLNLAPLYRKAFNIIHNNDPRHLVFFENALIDLAGKTGFTPATTPGGSKKLDKQVLSFHIYCGPTDRDGNPRSISLCDGEEDVFWRLAEDDIATLGTGSMLTEFGAVTNATNSIKTIDYMADKADQYGASWAYWQFKWFQDLTTSGSGEGFYSSSGQIEQNKVKHLARTYATAVQGTQSSATFDPASGNYTTIIQVDTTIQAPTMIFTNFEYYYQNRKPHITVSNLPSSYSVTVKSDGQIHYITATTTNPSDNHASMHISIIPSTF